MCCGLIQCDIGPIAIPSKLNRGLHRSDTEGYTLAPGLAPVGNGPNAFSLALAPAPSGPTPDIRRPGAGPYTTQPVSDPGCTPSCPTRCRGLYNLVWPGALPIRSNISEFMLLSGMAPALAGPKPKLVHRIPIWIGSKRNLMQPLPKCIYFLPARAPGLTTTVPECIQPGPTRYQSLCKLVRPGAGPIRPKILYCRFRSRMGPALAGPVPELIRSLPVWMRFDTGQISARSLGI